MLTHEMGIIIATVQVCSADELGGMQKIPSRY